ncbi:MAG: hypothetical protein U0165_15975 [Polyangiaceae bacterium]
MPKRRTFSTAVFLFSVIPFAALVGCSGGDDSTTNPGASGTAGSGGSAGAAGAAGSSSAGLWLWRNRRLRCNRRHGCGAGGSAGTGGSGGSAGTGGTSASECTFDTDCLIGFTRSVRGCKLQAGVCSRLFKDQGTTIDDPTPGDCHSATCDGAGGYSRRHGTDTPAQTDGDWVKAVCGSSGEITNSPDISDVPPQVAEITAY